MSGSVSPVFSDPARSSFLRSLLRGQGYLPIPGTSDVSIFGSWQGFCSRLPAPRAAYMRGQPGKDSPAGTLRVIHQPDLLAGFNIVGLLELARIAADIAQVPVTFSGLDYDTFTNHRFRSSMIPDIRGRACIRLGQLVPKADRRKLALSAGPADRSIVSTWQNVMLPSARFWRRHLGRNSVPVAPRAKLTEAEDQLAAHMNELCSVHPVTAAMTGGIRMLADLCFGFSPQIYSAASLVSSENDAVISLTREALRFNAGIADRLVWRICPKCHGRGTARVFEKTGSAYADWRCSSCDESGGDALDFTPDGSSAGLPKYVPQVMLCDLIDLIVYPATAAISYAGGLSHALAARTMAVHINGSALYPELFWDPLSLFESTIPAHVAPDIRSLWTSGKFSSWWYRLVYDPAYLAEVVIPNLSLARTGNCDER